MSNPKYFENPTVFDPERWTNNKGLSEPFSFLPFSGGTRNCIGQHLAMIETRIILVHFLKNFQFAPIEGK